MPVFEMNLLDFRSFQRMQQRNPKLYRRAAGHVLNSMAFGVRAAALRELKAQSIIRNQRFVDSSIRVDKARVGQPIESLRTEVGSIARPRFTGWEEQETGKQTPRKHQAWPAARQGNIRKQVIRIARLRGTGRFPRPSDFPGTGNPVARAIRMIHILSRSEFTAPFLILGLENKRGKKVPPGLYRFGEGEYPTRKIQLLQRFKSPKETKKDPWLKPATDKYLKSGDFRTVWGDAVIRELRRGGVRI